MMRETLRGLGRGVSGDMEQGRSEWTILDRRALLFNSESSIMYHSGSILRDK